MTATTIRVQMAQRKDTAANWTAANPILLSGELGYETDTEKFKIGDGTTNWNSLAYLPIPDGSGNLTITGNLEIGTTGTLTFEGSTADGFETTLAVTDPTADRTITLPDVTGTVVTTGDTGSVTSTMLADGTIVNADVSATAEIAVSKLANGTANQVIVTDGTNVSWSDDLTLAGNLTVNGTTTTVNTETLLVEDKNIELGVVGTPTDLTADGGGITLKGTTDKTINWVDATDAWTFSEHVDLASGKEVRIAGTKVMDATSLGSGVVSSSLTSLGTIGTGVWEGTAVATPYGGTGQTTYTDGQLLIGKTDGTLAKATVTAGTGITVTNGDGTITIDAVNNGTVTAVTGTSPIASTGGATPDISIQDATTTQKGAVQLEDSTSSTSTTTAATPNSVKAAYDLAANALPSTGGVMTGDLVFEGSTADDFETTLTVVDPTADRTITLPDVTGTVVTTGDSGTITSTMIADGTIVDADVNASAAIAGTKISPNFGSQNVTTTGTSTAASFIPTSSTVPTNGFYLPAANSVALSTNGTGRLFVDASGNVGIGAVPGQALLVSRSAANSLIQITDGTINTYWGASTTFSAAIIDVATNTPFRIATNNQERLRITSAGLVGIGTSNPGYPLDVQSEAGGAGLRIRGGSGGLSVLQFTDNAISSQWGTITTASTSCNIEHSSIVRFTTASTERVRIDSSGRVGIGTTSPNDKLHVMESSASAAAPTGASVAQFERAGNASITISTADTGVAALYFGDTVSSTVGALLYGHSDNSLQFATASTERARIDSSGRLLVGTSNPYNSSSGVSGNFQLHGLGANSAKANFGAWSNDSFPTSFYFGKSRGTLGNQVIVNSGDGLGDFLFEGSDGTKFVRAAAIQAVVDGTPGANDMPGRLVFSTTADGASSPTERMRIDSAGFISLGGDTNTGFSNPSADNLAITTGGSERARIDSSGRLLVGTSSAFTTSLLQIQGTSSSAIGPGSIRIARGIAAADFSTGNEVGSILFTDNAGGTFASIGSTSDAGAALNDYPGRLVFSTTANGASSPTERMRITSAGVLQVADAGNIAVGTTTGTKIGTATTQKLGFYNATPVVQPAAVADATDAATVITQLNDLLAKLRTLGIIAT